MDVFYNKLEADPSTIGMDIVGGRLDLVSATSIKWGFQNSNQIRLVNPDTGRWELVKVATEPTIANTALDLNGTALAVDKIYDVFAEYSSGTAFTLVASRWQTATAGTSSRTAAWVGSTAYKIGDRVSNSSHYYCCIDDHTSHATTFSNDAAKWADNGVAANVGSSDFYGLYRQDGVLVSDSSTTGKSRRWLGIIYTYNNSGTVNFKDDVNYRYVSNFYNRTFLQITSYNTANTWTYNTNTPRESSGGANQIRGNFVICRSQSDRPWTISQRITKTGGAYVEVGIAINSTSSPLGWASNAVNGELTYTYISTVNAPCGFNFITTIEQCYDTTTFQSYNGGVHKGTYSIEG